MVVEHALATDATEDYALQRNRIRDLEAEVTRLRSLLLELYCGGRRAVREAREEIRRLDLGLPRAGVNLTCAERGRVRERELRRWRNTL